MAAVPGDEGGVGAALAEEMTGHLELLRPEHMDPHLRLEAGLQSFISYFEGRVRAA